MVRKTQSVQGDLNPDDFSADRVLAVEVNAAIRRFGYPLPQHLVCVMTNPEARQELVAAVTELSARADDLEEELRFLEQIFPLDQKVGAGVKLKELNR